MRVGSLFSGIGGIDLGFERAGFEVAWQCEIDPHARRVLERHWPGVHIYGDVREVGSGADAVDVLVGGFPCQDVSVAGRRAGLAGERSGLWFEFHRVLRELRPGWVVIENVPGLLSSCGCLACGAVRRIIRVHAYLRRKREIRESCAICRAGGAMLRSHRGRDFALLLRGLVELGYGVCWRILDAQHFGVAQRRRRVFIVGHLGDGRAAEVLFEPESVFGDPPARRAAGERIAGTLGGGAGNRGWADDLDRAGAFVVADTLTVGANQYSGFVGEPVVANAIQASAGHQRGDGSDNLVVETIRSHPRPDSNTTGPLVISRRGRGDGLSDEIEEGISPALRTGGGGSSVSQIVFDPAQVTSPENRSNPQPGDPCHPLAAEGYVPVMVAQAMSSKWSKGSSGPAGDEHQNLVAPAGAVRRLTPVECSRLQGFPDGWTEGQADSHRYKQLGNAVCVPVAEWIARRIAEVAP